MDNSTVTINNATKPKKKIVKIILLTIAVILLGVAIWVGVTAYNTIKKVTGLSTSGNNSLLSLFGNKGTQLKGQSEGRTNILLLGIGGGSHPGASLSDTMQVISINWKTNQVAMISIPRDLWVNVPGHGFSKINEANSIGGGDLASQTVSQVLGIPIQYYVTMDFDGFKEIIDKLGGVDVNVPTAILDRNYPLYDDGPVTTFSISAGMQHLTGDIALKYARSRESTSDFDRSKRQQLIMIAVKEKVLSAGLLANPAKITSLMNSVGNHIKTTLSVSEIKTLWDEIQKIDTSQMISKVIDNSATGLLNSSTSGGGASIQIPKKGIGNYADLQALAQNIFNTTDTTNSTNSKVEGTSTTITSPRISVLNGSGVAGAGTTAANKITALGYKVSTIDTTAKTTKTTVYNCTGTAVSSVVKKIVTLLGAQEKSKTSCGSIDIQVVIGQN
jgi:LCP family protein required for cell wall assembly